MVQKQSGGIALNDKTKVNSIRVSNVTLSNIMHEIISAYVNEELGNLITEEHVFDEMQVALNIKRALSKKCSVIILEVEY